MTIKRIKVELPEMAKDELIEIDISGHILLTAVKTYSELHTVAVQNGRGDAIYKDEELINKI